jgi:WS/DGAT/MGAT family acyltransferase
VTVNDVVLGLCAGALRGYLDGLGEEPEGPLMAMVPVSVRTDDEKGAMGNRVSNMTCSLATDVDDPVERLQAIHEGTRGAKEQLNAVGADSLTDWAEFAAPALLGRAARFYSRAHLADRHKPLFNVTISNVPGPPFPLYSSGARMIANYPMGPIFDGGGINITVMSYLDQLDFGVVVCSDLVEDPWVITDGIQSSLDELRAIADKKASKAAASNGKTASAPNKRATKRTTKSS